jgi:hypothetical protein
MTPDLQKLVAFIRDARSRQTSDEFAVFAVNSLARLAPLVVE